MPPSVIPEGAVGAAATAAVVVAAEIPVSDVNPCAGALVVEAAAGAPKDKGFAAPVAMDNEGAGAAKIEVVPPLGAPPKEKLLDGVVDAPNAEIIVGF